MKDFIKNNLSTLQELKILVYDNDLPHYGGNQYWFPRRTNRINGCGPVAAANITAYLSLTFPKTYGNLYHLKEGLSKSEFVSHMIEIRKFVKPGFFGLTSVQQFSNNLLSFSESKGVSLTPFILDDDRVSMLEALEFIYQGLHQRLPVSILVLKHPAQEIKEHVWHWMTITHLRFEPTNGKYYIFVSTYGEFRIIDFDILWNNRGPKDIIKLAYFK